MPPPVDETYLADGVTLRPITSRLSVFDLAALGGAGFRQWAILEPLAHAATCEIETAADAAVVPGYDPLNRAWLLTALLVLRGYTQVLAPACCSYSWNTVAGHQERTSGAFQTQLATEGAEAAVFASNRSLPSFGGGILDYHVRISTASSPRLDPLQPNDVEWVAAHFEVFNHIASTSDSFRLALEAAVDWRYFADQRSALARVWAGIEALLGISSELVFRIALYSAALLEPRGATRRRRFAAVKGLYSDRSKAVHGDAVQPDKLTHALEGSFRLLADLLLHSVELGHALTNDDFERAVFD
jgi:hypothetical protein